jgi:ABC-type transport system involved in multi-copper enzyme maturation permease subunit
VSAQLRAELLKQRTTRTNLGLVAAMLALVLAAVLMHGLLLGAENLADGDDQLQIVFGWGEVLGALFAALLGAMSFTGEFRHGTIRPTLLVTPRRGRVVAGKLVASVLIGTAFGLLAAGVSAGAASAALAARGIDIQIQAGDYAVLLFGSAGAGALWAAIGVGIGAAIRNQVPVLVGICAWLLFVETVLIGDANLVGDIGRFTPGALGQAASGQEPQLAPGLAVVLLALYAAAAAAAGWLVTTRRDVA